MWYLHKSVAFLNLKFVVGECTGDDYHSMYVFNVGLGIYIMEFN